MNTQKRITYVSKKSRCILNPDRIAEVFVDIGNGLKNGVDEALKDSYWLKGERPPVLYLSYDEGTVVIKTQAVNASEVVATSEVLEDFDLAVLAWPKDVSTLTLIINKHPRVTVPCGWLEAIGTQYAMF